MSESLSNISADKQEGVLDFDIEKLFYTVLSYKYLIITGLAIGLIISFLYLRYTPETYKSTAKVLIKDDKKGGAALDNPLLRDLNLASTGKTLDNEIQIFKSFDLMAEVVKNLKLNIQILKKGRFIEIPMYKNAPFDVVLIGDSTYHYNFSLRLFYANEKWKWECAEGQCKPRDLVLNNMELLGTKLFMFSPKDSTLSTLPPPSGFSEYEIIVSSVPSTVSYFLSNLKFSPATKFSSVVDIEVTDLAQTRATAVLEEVINVYNQQGLYDKNMTSQNTMDFLDRRLLLLENEIINIENSVRGFKSENKVTEVQSEANRYLSLATTLDPRISEVKTRLVIIESLEQEVKENLLNPGLMPATLDIGEPTLSFLIQRNNDLVMSRDRMANLAGPLNPELEDIKNQIAIVRNSILTNIINLKSSYRIQIDDLLRREAVYDRRLAEIPVLEKELLDIQRDQAVKKGLYGFLLQKREESAIALASSVNDSRIIEIARPVGKIFPKPMNVWMFGVAGGITVSMGIIFLLFFLNNKVGSKKDVEANCIAPLLGEINFVKDADNILIIKDGKRTGVAEQLRSIRTAITFTGKGNAVNKVMVTSHRPGEGKSFTSLNLAASYALLNKKTVILEFDLRKPRILKNLGMKSPVGIANLLTGTSTIEACIQKVPGYSDNLFVLPSGPTPPNPAELIEGPYMQQMIDQLEERFDIIIFDTPPFSIVTDATLLQKFADISIIVIRQGYSVNNVFHDINKRVQLYPETPSYVVLNGVGKSAKYSYGYGYGYGYDYGYGYGYYGDDNTKKSLFKRIFSMPSFFKKGSSKDV